ncbi:hypothetical protein C1886_18695 [Pseudomonas sp. FW300-N1A1]|nr:hypothetical protein C1886_18695 [Pseudomonas sp. FW300-N1A1]
MFVPAVVRAVGDLSASYQKGLIHHDSNCGSGLAREGCLPVDIYSADTPHSRASPLPQGICCDGDKSVRYKKAANKRGFFVGGCFTR